VQDVTVPAAPTSFTTVAGLRDAVGVSLGHSSWLQIDQARIDAFAAATGDDQWIHVDPERAAAGPFGRTIAHGWLTASLLSGLAAEVYRVDGASMAVNYGSDKIRFLSPVPVDCRIRVIAELAAVVPLDDGCRVTARLTAEIEGGDRPACVADIVTVWRGLA